MKDQGRTAKAIGQIVGLSAISVTRWLNRYEAEGIAGLQTRAGRGRPRVFDESRDGEVVKAAVREERQRLEQAKQKLEAHLGKTFSTQTLKRFLKNLAAPANVSAAVPSRSATLNSLRSV